MKNKYKFIFLSGFVAANCVAKADVFDDMFVGFEEAIVDMKEQLRQTREHATKALKKAEQSVKSFSGSLSLGLDVKLKEEKDHVEAVIDLNLGKDSTKADDSQVDIKAKGRALDGVLKYGDHDVKFFVTDGQILRVSYKYNSTKEGNGKDKDDKYYYQSSSSHTQSAMLPTHVHHLEDTKAVFRDGKLVLSMPKKDSLSKRGWRKIEVK